MSKKIKKDEKTATELYNETFPTRLREVMEKQKVTQAMLAAEIGVSRQSVAKYTSGIAQPNIEALQAITIYLQVSGDYLIGVSNSSPLEPDINNACKYTGLSKQAINAIKNITKDASPEGRASNIEILNTLLEKEIMTNLIKAFEFYVLCTCTGKLTFEYNSDIHRTIPIDPKIIAEWFLDNELERATEKIKETLLNNYSDLYRKKDSP